MNTITKKQFDNSMSNIGNKVLVTGAISAIFAIIAAATGHIVPAAVILGIATVGVVVTIIATIIPLYMRIITTSFS